MKGRSDVTVGAQNVHWEPKGAFTGAISIPMVTEVGARLTLVGHSERRHLFGETDEQVGRKTRAALAAGITPLVCVGETLAERDGGRTEHVIVRQLGAVLAALQPQDWEQVVLAYEPVWAIGTGKNATPDDAAQIHELIRMELGRNRRQPSSPYSLRRQREPGERRLVADPAPARRCPGRRCQPESGELGRGDRPGLQGQGATVRRIRPDRRLAQHSASPCNGGPPIMPELPDITLYLEQLAPRILGQPLLRLVFRSPFILRSVEPPPSVCEGKRVTGLQRLGKRIVLAVSRTSSSS